MINLYIQRTLNARQFCREFGGDNTKDFMINTVYNRQAAVAYNRTLSHKAGRQIRRMTPIIDLKGFSLSHLSPEFVRLCALTITALIHTYPEATSGFYGINVPSAFMMLWRMMRPLLDADTLAKTKLMGGPKEYEPVFAKLGIVLAGPSDQPPTIKELKPRW